MSRFPYDVNPAKAFDQIEADAIALDTLSREMEQSAEAIEKMPDGSKTAVDLLRIRAKRLRRIAACLGYVAGRVDRLHLLNEPVRRESNYGASQRRVA